MRAWIMLGILLLGILFPVHWIGQFSSIYERVFNRIFSPEWMHIAMHTALSAALGALLVIVTRPPLRWSTLWLLSITILGVGILQELFQWFTQDKIVPATVVLRSSGFDLWIDWMGGLLGIMGLFWINRKLGRLLPQAKQG